MRISPAYPLQPSAISSPAATLSDLPFFLASNESPEQTYSVENAIKINNSYGRDNAIVYFVSDKGYNSDTDELLTVENKANRINKIEIRRLERYEFPKSSKTRHKRKGKRPRCPKNEKLLRACLSKALEEIPAKKNEGEKLLPASTGENETREEKKPRLSLVNTGVMAIITLIGLIFVNLVVAGSQNQTVYNYGGVMTTAFLPLLMIGGPDLSGQVCESEKAATEQQSFSTDGEIIRETRKITVEA